jgi:hypothetical protein
MLGRAIGVAFYKDCIQAGLGSALLFIGNEGFFGAKANYSLDKATDITYNVNDTVDRP